MSKRRAASSSQDAHPALPSFRRSSSISLACRLSTAASDSTCEERQLLSMQRRGAGTLYGHAMTYSHTKHRRGLARHRGQCAALHVPMSSETFNLTLACRKQTSPVCDNGIRCDCHTSLTTALLTIRLAREAKRSVEWDSSTCGAAGVTLQMMAVLALPPSDGCRMRVSLLSLYGM